MLAECAAHEVLAIGLIGEDEDGVGVCVVHELVGQERVQERFERGVHGLRVEHAQPQLVHHGFVTQAIEGLELAQPLEVENGKVTRFDRREVSPGPLDAKDVARAPEDVLGARLDGGVSAAVQDELLLSTDQTGGVDPEGHVCAADLSIDFGRAGSFFIAPQALHGALQGSPAGG